MRYKALLLLSLVLLLSVSPTHAAQTEPGCIEHAGDTICMAVTSQTTPTPTPTGVPTLTATPTPANTATAQSCNDSYYPIYNNAQTPFYGTISSNLTPSWSGVAATASTFTFYGDAFKGRKIHMAKWIVAWNPNNASNATRVKLVAQDLSNGYAETVLAELVSVGVTPIAQLVVVTLPLQAFVDNGTPVLIGHKPVGNGTAGALVYLSRVEILWEC
jgi:hypothetical protein